MCHPLTVNMSQLSDGAEIKQRFFFIVSVSEQGIQQAISSKKVTSHHLEYASTASVARDLKRLSEVLRVNFHLQI